MAPGVRERVPEQVVTAMLDNDRDVVVDALLAVRVLARSLAEKEMRGEFAHIANMLIQGVQWRHRPALADRLRVVADLVKNQSWFLSTEALTGLLAGLAQIAEETSSGVRGNDQDGVITIRTSAGALAFALFGYYQESGIGPARSNPTLARTEQRSGRVFGGQELMDGRWRLNGRPRVICKSCGHVRFVDLPRFSVFLS